MHTNLTWNSIRTLEIRSKFSTFHYKYFQRLDKFSLKLLFDSPNILYKKKKKKKKKTERYFQYKYLFPITSRDREIYGKLNNNKHGIPRKGKRN